MKSYAVVLGLNLPSKEKKNKGNDEKIQRKEAKENIEKAKEKDLLKIIKVLNQQIVKMKQMMVEICHIVINNPSNKEDLLEKMKEIKEIEEHEIIINEK